MKLVRTATMRRENSEVELHWDDEIFDMLESEANERDWARRGVRRDGAMGEFFG